MSENPTPEEVRASIVPKSDQLNADDLIAGPLTVTITKVRRGDREQPIIVELGEGQRPYKPCKTMRRVLIAIFGDDPKEWVGKRLTLYRDDEVKWAGVKVGGIRISHLSGIDNPRTLLLTEARGKRSETTIMPLESEDNIEDIKDQIAAAVSMEALKAIGFVLKTKPRQVQDAVRDVYRDRQTQFEQGF